MALTDDQLTDMRNDLADNHPDKSFSDDELQRLYERTGEDYNRAIVTAIQQLMMNAVKLETWEKNNKSLDGEQVFRRLERMRDLWQSLAQERQSQIAIGGLQQQPKRYKDRAATENFSRLPRRRRY